MADGEFRNLAAIVVDIYIVGKRVICIVIELKKNCIHVTSRTSEIKGAEIIIETLGWNGYFGCQEPTCNACPCGACSSLMMNTATCEM